MKLTVTSEVKALGIDARLAVISGATISNKSLPLEKLKKEACEILLKVDPAQEPVLQAYRDLHRAAGLSAEVVPPAEHLLKLIQKNGRLPNINTVVDCYNLISVQSLLSIGAHDLAQVQGDVAFRLTTGTELYVPLGETAPQKVEPGEYACLDEEKIICRMDIKQCNQTKITKETGSFLIYVQGNREVSIQTIEQTLEKVCVLIVEICGGSYTIVG